MRNPSIASRRASVFRCSGIFFLSLALSCPVGFGDAPKSFVQGMTHQQLIETGRQAFLNRCSGCHGVNADGKGVAAPMLSPKPRNLVEGSFKFRTTPGGILPTTQDLLRTIDVGVLGTSMPSFRDVGAQEKLAIVTYVRSLRPEFASTLSEQVSADLPPPPKDLFLKKADLLTAAKRGKVVYQTGCFSCHGPEGRGDGPAAEELTDSENQPIRPANLRKRFVKSGKTARDVFRALSVGLDGSPMPAYESSFNAAQRWDLVAYIFYLRGVEAGIYGEQDLLK